MTSRRDWLKLKNEFITGTWATVADFLRDKQVKDNSRVRSHTTGWVQQRIAYQEQVAAVAKEKLIETEVDTRIRHQRIAKSLQVKGLEGLQENPVPDAETARKLLVSGMQEEREALGLNDKVKSATQINVGFGKTKLDGFLEQATYEQVLALIADLKREKERRALSDKSVVKE